MSLIKIVILSFFGFTAILIGIVLGISLLIPARTPLHALPDPPPPVYSSTTSSDSNFRCAGKTHCSHMNSCEEAKFYLRNCPGVKIDGNHDGIPCEKQWCNRNH